MANYLAELEQLWQQNRNRPSALKALLRPPPNLPSRLKALRGRDFALELSRLSAMTGDARFKDALLALAQHRIIDRNFNFLPWEMPFVTEGREKVELLMCASIHLLRSHPGTGGSLRRACAEFAAREGWPATSFAAAMKDVELRYRRRRYRDHRHLSQAEINLVKKFLKKFMTPACAAAFEADFPTTKTTELEKSCSTSIPTTANN